jgi:hypothetical protein
MPPPQRRAPTHDCPCGCGRSIAQDRFACRAGWYRLPVKIRTAILDGYYGRHGVDHFQAMQAGTDYYRANPIPRRTAGPVGPR